MHGSSSDLAVHDSLMSQSLRVVSDGAGAVRSREPESSPQSDPSWMCREPF